MQRRQKNPFELSRNEPRAKTKRECKMAAGTGEKTRWESLSLRTILPIWFSFPHEYEAWLKWKRAAGMHTNAGDAAATALYCVELILTPSHTHLCTQSTHTRSTLIRELTLLFHHIHWHRNMRLDMWCCQVRHHTLRIPSCIKNSFWKVLIIIDASCCVQSTDINLLVLVKCKHTFMYTEKKKTGVEICFIYNFIKITFTVYLL